MSVEKAIAKHLSFEVVAKRADTRVVYAWASVSKDAKGRPVVDLDGDHIEIAELEKASHRFMRESRASGDMHRGDADGVVVASLVTTAELQKAMGIPEGTVPEGWIVGVQVPQAVYDQVAKGERVQMSIEGRAVRETSA